MRVEGGICRLVFLHLQLTVLFFRFRSFINQLEQVIMTSSNHEKTTLEELKAKLAACDKLAEKPEPTPRVSHPVDPADARLHPQDFILVAGRNLAHRCTAQSRQQKRRCKRAVSPGMRVCHNHGGKNRGPTTPEGLARCATGTVHGNETRQKRRDRKAGHARMRVLERAVDKILKFEERRRGMR